MKTVANMPIKQQTYKTSCWISTAHYVLNFLGIPALPTLRDLENNHYSPDQNSSSSMTGAGNPANLLEQYAAKHGFKIESIVADNEEEVMNRIEKSIENGIPVIAGIKCGQIYGFGHAVVITAISKEAKILAIKDPAKPNKSNPFLSDYRVLSFKDFLSGFVYGYSDLMKLKAWAYCYRVVVISK